MTNMHMKRCSISFSSVKYKPKAQGTILQSLRLSIIKKTENKKCDKGVEKLVMEYKMATLL